MSWQMGPLYLNKYYFFIPMSNQPMKCPQGADNNFVHYHRHAVTIRHIIVTTLQKTLVVQIMNND